jgi:phage terminase large subunit-like protein
VSIVLPPGAEYDEARADRVVRFCARYLKHMKGRWAGQPFVLEPWQEHDIIRPLFGTIDPATGRRWYREALIGVSRKNGKSELAAAIALYLLIADDEFGAEVYSLAGDRKQASLVYKTAADMAKGSPFRSAVRVYRSVMEVPETSGIYRALSADADLQHGLNPHGAIIDEYHVHRDAEQYEAMRTGTAARLQSLIVTITTAGAEKRGPLWSLYERATSGQDPRLFLYWKAVKPGTSLDDLDAFKEANPASWVTREFLADQRASLPEPVFRRLHGNEWYEAGGTLWVPSAAWHACAGDVLIEPEKPAVIAVDAASKRDTTAVALVQRAEDNRFHTRVWLMRADDEVGYLDYEQVEALIRDLAATYDIRRIGFDPYQMVPVAQRLDAEGLPVELFPQSHVRMVPASGLLYDAIMEQRLVHDGDPEITEQVLSAGVREVPQGWRLDKRVRSRSIDAAIALAMGVQLAEWETSQSAAPRVLVI